MDSWIFLYSELLTLTEQHLVIGQKYAGNLHVYVYLCEYVSVQNTILGIF